MTPLNWQDHDLTHPLSLTDPHRIDVPDIFGDGFDDATRDQYFAVMALTPQHTYMLATENAERMAEWCDYAQTFDNTNEAICELNLKVNGDLDAPVRPDEGEWFKNVWFGARIYDQQTADERIPHLLRCPAVVRWLDCVLREAVELRRWMTIHWRCSKCGGYFHEYSRSCPDCDQIGGLSGSHPFNGRGFPQTAFPRQPGRGIDFLRVRGGVAPVHPDWVRSLRDQCAEAGVPFAFESWGDWVVASDHNLIRFGRQWDADDADCCWLDADGRTKRGSSHGLSRIAYAMIRVGRAASGRLLDGVLHDAYPQLESEVGR